MKKFVLLLATMLLLLLPVVGMAAAADLQITKVEYTGVDQVLKPQDQFTVTAYFNGELDRAQEFGITFIGTSIYYSPKVYFSEGKVEFTCYLPKNIKTGTHDLHSISVYEDQKETKIYPDGQSFPRLTIECENTTCPDFDRPVVSNVSLDQHGQTVYPGSTLSVQMKIEDASSITRVSAEFAPDMDDFDNYFMLDEFSYNAATKTYTVTGEVPENAKLGKNYLLIVGADDEWENFNYANFSSDAFYVVVAAPNFPTSSPATETPVVTSIDKVTTVTKPTAVVPETGIPGLKLVVGNYDLKELVNTTGGTVANIAAYDLHLEDEFGDKITHIGEKIVVYLPYPAGYNMNSNVTWTLKHYKNDFSSYTLMPLFPTEKGLRFETDSFSPYVLTWTAKTAAVPSTGDNTPIALLTLLALVSLSAMVLIVRRKEA